MWIVVAQRAIAAPPRARHTSLEPDGSRIEHAVETLMRHYLTHTVSALAVGMTVGPLA
jgi:hypothetical protein